MSLLVYLVFRQQTIGCLFFWFFKAGSAAVSLAGLGLTLRVFTHAPDHSLDRSHPCFSPRRAVLQSDVLYE